MSTQARKGAVRIPRGESVWPVAFMFVAGAYFLLPLWWLLVSSTKSRGDLTTTPGLWFSDIRLLDNIEDLFTRGDGVFWRWLLNSLLYAGRRRGDRHAAGGHGGYALAKYEFRGPRGPVRGHPRRRARSPPRARRCRCSSCSARWS
jgi:multiple sugar transport system permease protein